MSRHVPFRVTLIAGDGVGQDVIPAAGRVLSALDLDLDLQEAHAGFTTFEHTGAALPPKTLAACEASDAVLFGATQSPMTKVAGYRSPILELRAHFNLWANVRPARHSDIDMLIVRENSEGLYVRREKRTSTADDQTAVAERVITQRASERIVRLACEHALRRSGRLTLVHKANVLKETCGLFRETAFTVTANYPALQVDEMLVDACAMRMALNPQAFDVLVTTNLFGDILSDLAAGLCGGLGTAPSANIGDGVPVFEPVHGSAPDIAGTNTADPRAAILSAGLLLRTLGFTDEATHLETITHTTPHIGNTHQTTQHIIDRL